MLPGSNGARFISSGLSCVLGSLAAAGSVHVQGVHQCQRQGKHQIFFKSLISSITDFFALFHTMPRLTLLDCAYGQLSSWLIPAVQNLNVSTMAPPELSALGGLLPQLGASFLLSLPSQQLLEILSQPGLHRYSPSQVSREFVSHVASCHSYPGAKLLNVLHHFVTLDISKCSCKCIKLSWISMKVD